ncbi:MAG: hypothetical protein A3E78_15625 [Alphaproteobacteria bacterium RIFCSPHIGHO2_12_FULL_63_12]|nr:MAG: hypothetical protein A3E78_15625 [Alphaproteobacteria bacterium RIFCSPHIGHO2_12_FULL_63_12]
MENALRSLVIAAILLASSVQTAAAATAVFATSVYGTSGSVAGASNALGAADGASATILRVAGGSNLILQMSQATSGLNTLLSGARLTLGSNVQIAIGEVIGGVAVFSTNLTLPGGFGPTYALDLSALCTTVSSTGCSLLRIRVGGAPGSGFLLDGVSGVAATPEPSTWLLMILGFGALAFRLKQRRAPALALA